MNEEDKELLERAMALNDRLLEAVKESKDAIDTTTPIMKEHMQILNLVKDYLTRLKECGSLAQEGKADFSVPNAHDYLMMISNVLSHRL